MFDFCPQQLSGWSASSQTNPSFFVQSPFSTPAASLATNKQLADNLGARRNKEGKTEFPDRVQAKYFVLPIPPIQKKKYPRKLKRKANQLFNNHLSRWRTYVVVVFKIRKKSKNFSLLSNFATASKHSLIPRILKHIHKYESLVFSL